jgi:hypothetical protein
MMTVRTIRPPFTPYQPGDPISVEYHDDKRGTVLAELTVERCVKLAGPENDPRWRVTVRRQDGRLHDANVDQHGRDRHGYVRKPERAR